MLDPKVDLPPLIDPPPPVYPLAAITVASSRKKTPKPPLGEKCKRAAKNKEKIIHQNEKPKGKQQNNKTSAASLASQKSTQAKKAGRNIGKG